VQLRVVLIAAMLASHAAYACPRDTETKLLGLPVWVTDPNEGNTFGAMPILIGVCPTDHETRWIVAPSITWNSLVRYTGTLRWYWYPDRESSLAVIASASTQTNYQLFVTWLHLPRKAGTWTDETVGRIQRTIFPRFFGLGPTSMARAESSYTLARVSLAERRGLNLGHDFNAGVLAGIEYDDVLPAGIPDLPSAPMVFADVPGMTAPSTIVWQGLALRYDDRDGGDYADQGVRGEAWGSVAEGLQDAPVFVRGGIQISGLWQEADGLAGAARAMWTATTGDGVPFYDRSQLGGAFLLRGFAEGRFVARQAWTIETEQRIRLLTTHVFGVAADWRLDPFVAAGQVFDSFGEATAHPRVAAGAGLRAFIHPNVLGRIDLAAGGEGLKAYVEIGYPY
jgi:hypothetical protein